MTKYMTELWLKGDELGEIYYLDGERYISSVEYYKLIKQYNIQK